ncbi:MAG: hypothetical protein NC906_04175 [Candidatus Omnitrophica bacterium]|nr:hypothetical protein [Candidatus Omnitrophota bacterium]
MNWPLVKKEFKEGRSILITLCLLFPLVTLVFGFWTAAILISLVSMFFGAESMSKEKGKFDFLLGLPVKRTNIIYTKLLSGAFYILFFFFLCLIILSVTQPIILKITGKNGSHFFVSFKNPSFDFFLIPASFSLILSLYCATFFASILVGEVATSFLTGGIFVYLFNVIFLAVLGKLVPDFYSWFKDYEYSFVGFQLFLGGLFIYLSFVTFNRLDIKG